MICTALAIGLHLGTLHFTEPLSRNGLNPGVYAVCDDWVAGTYLNSQSHISEYAGRVWHVRGVDLTAGVVGGYRGHRVMPFVLPSVKVSEHVRLSLLPPTRSSSWGGIHASWEF